MIEITSTELRRNMGKYLELATTKQEKVLIRYRNKRLFSLTLEAVNESRAEKTVKNEKYFEQPEVLKAIRQGKADIEAGRCVTIKDPNNIWESILS
jgi:PHD/YefM family antitoxin component YafN of YafNO toxin-antitoxin module